MNYVLEILLLVYGCCETCIGENRRWTQTIHSSVVFFQRLCDLAAQFDADNSSLLKV